MQNIENQRKNLNRGRKIAVKKVPRFSLWKMLKNAVFCIDGIKEKVPKTLVFRTFLCFTLLTGGPDGTITYKVKKNHTKPIIY